jgi:hypothetical protein
VFEFLVVQHACTSQKSINGGFFSHAAENRKIRGICPCPAIREGDTRVGVLRVSGRTSRVYARPTAGFPRCCLFPNISIIALSAPKEKGFPSLLLCFAAERGKMLFSVNRADFQSAKFPTCEIPYATKKCSWFSLQIQMKSSEIK